MLGLGVWQVPNGPECVNAVRWALEVGYQHIDTAQAYGNEESVGRALHESGVSREEVSITTKFFPRQGDPAAEIEDGLRRDRVALFRVCRVKEKRTSSARSEDSKLLARLRAGDERAFRSLVETHHATMIAVAGTYVRTRAVAEEVVQEAWLGVIKGIDRFEGRSSLKTWILRIVVNTALASGAREARTRPFSALAPAEDPETAVEADRFRRPGEAFAGHWTRYPGDWGSLPEERLLGREILEVAKRGIEQLPDGQRTVITMRDIAGCSAEEVCEVLDISAVNQRVLLHRARSKVRAALERHLDE